jgi:hypothetical protein
MGRTEAISYSGNPVYGSNPTPMSVSGMLNLKSHYNLISGYDTELRAPPVLVGYNYSYINSYYNDSTDRSTWSAFPSTSIVSLNNNPSSPTVTVSSYFGGTLKRGDIIIVIMMSAQASGFHVPGATSTVYTKTRTYSFTSFGTITTASGTSVTAFWHRIPTYATDAQLADEYLYLSRNDVTAGANLPGTATTTVGYVTEVITYVLRGAPTSSTPIINTTITGAITNADNNEPAQKAANLSFGKPRTSYLNYVYTPINLGSSPPDAYPDAIAGTISNDFYPGSLQIWGSGYSDNGVWETFSRSWISDNIPDMYSTSPTYNNKKLIHNFYNITYPAITGFYDVTGWLLIEIPY